MEQNVGLSSHRPPVRRMAKMRQENLGGDSLLGLQRHSTGSPKGGWSISFSKRPWSFINGVVSQGVLCRSVCDWDQMESSDQGSC